MSAIGDNIKKYRELKGLTQKELAESIGKTKNVISNWENGLNKPDIDTIELIMGVLDINDAKDILGWSTKKDIEDSAKKASNKALAELTELLSSMSDKDIELVNSFVKRLK
jgi:transcriptional regulator with XRE-family HTH domain